MHLYKYYISAVSGCNLFRVVFSFSNSSFAILNIQLLNKHIKKTNIPITTNTHASMSTVFINIILMNIFVLFMIYLFKAR